MIFLFAFGIAIGIQGFELIYNSPYPYNSILIVGTLKLSAVLWACSLLFMTIAVVGIFDIYFDIFE